MTHEILFSIGKYGVPSYSFFVLLGLIIGGLTFYLLSRKSKINSDNLTYIFFAGLIGGVLGAKIPVWIINFNQIILLRGQELLFAIASGRTLVGGLIGGFLGVEYIKKKLKIKQSTGDLFAPSIAIGIAIGRIGCFLRGCCGGIKTNLPWAIEGRHPTQLYESLFHFVSFLIMLFFMKKYSKAVKKGKLKQGDMFKFYILAYAVFRFFTEFLRADEIMNGVLSIAQYVCLAVILILGVYFLKRFIKFRRLK